MVNVGIEIPDALEPFVKPENERDCLLRNAMLIFPSIKNETISYGRATEILNVRKFDLITLYGSLGIPYFDLSEEELQEDLQNIDAVLEYAK
ncbi:MAG: UPF0175 family protein [Selenomonadaceae bacterium]|nr:UPF0175 family protein [Selenomonadaceae bacterium]